MKEYLAQYDWLKIRKHATIALCALAVLFGAGYIPFFPGAHNEHVFAPTTKRARATYQFFPTGGAIVTGAATNTEGMMAASTTYPVNMGDWRGTLAQDNLYWAFTSTAGGYNTYLDLGDVQLNGANKIIIQTGMLLTSANQTTMVQICDWVSPVGVANPADSQCTGGGWRNLNLASTTINATTYGAYDWEIYDGYWAANATTSISTPLGNFVNGSNAIRIRYYSTGSAAGKRVGIDFLRSYVVVDPVYSSAGASILSGSAVSPSVYSFTNIGGAGQTGVDGNNFRVAGSASATSSFYLSYKNVNAYNGANTLLARSTYSCSAAGINIAPKIYNFSSSQWENLTTGTIACNTTATTSAWAKSGINVGNYISGGEVRIGWFGSAPATTEIRIDAQYVMIGTTYSGGASSVTFGTLSAGATSSTATLDTTGTLNSWNITSVAKSNTQGFAQNGYDSDDTATAGRAVAANFDLPMNVPAGSSATGLFFAGNVASANATAQVQMGLKDYGGSTSVLGGWSPAGAVATTSLVYTDNMTMNSVASGGAAGWSTNPEDHLDTVGGKVNVRLRTTLTVNASYTAQWDFAMVSLQWTEDGTHPSLSYQYTPTGGRLVTGTAANILGLTAPVSTGVNMGDWRGTLAQDNLHWGFTSTASGYNAYLDLGNVQLNGANKILIQTGFVLASANETTLVQICDWTSATGVNNAADSQCTGGGWRTLNLNGTKVAPTTATSYDWEIYDGYWNSNATTKILTPLSDFVNGSSTMRIRFYSTGTTLALTNIDFLRVYVVTDPVYSASGATLISPGDTVTGSYASSTIGGAGQTGTDGAYFAVAGTAATTSNFYLSYQNIKTFPGANAILVGSTFLCSAAGLSVRPKIYNFTSTAWEDLTTGTIACPTSATTTAWAKGSIANIGDYVSGNEIRIGWYGTSNSTTAIRIDAQYVMLGAVNTSGTSEITYGTNSAGSVTNTRDLDMTGTTNVWSLLGAAKSNSQGFASYGYDADNTASAGYGVAANVDFNVSVPQNAYPTGLFYAARFMSGVSGTTQIGFKDYSGLTTTQGGWVTVGANSTTALTYTDNINRNTVAFDGAQGYNVNAQDCFDAVAGKVNLRLRTSATGASQETAQWDFAMVAPEWTEVPAVAQSLTFSISTTTIGFGPLSNTQSAYATANGNGTTTSGAIAHTITASGNGAGGYVLTLNGTTLTAASGTVPAIGGSATTSQVGVGQFGMNMSAVGGFGVVQPPYNTTGYAFDTTNFPDVVAQNTTNDSTPTTYLVSYVANIDQFQAAGSYTANLSYDLTATF